MVISSSMIPSIPQILLIGNGINLAYKDKSWEEIVRKELSKNSVGLSWEDIKTIPSTMQIVLATKNHVNTCLSDFAKEMENQSLSNDRTDFLRKLSLLPMDCFLSTNYGFEIEKAMGFVGNVHSYRTKTVWTDKARGIKDQFRFYQYYPLEQVGGAIKELWHIHGDIAKPNGMVMGHYYYGKLIGEIQKHIPEILRDYRSFESKGISYTPKSWVDWFMISDVYILGFGMYLCESDIWWLLCCKQREFPKTKVLYYPGSMKKNDERRLLLEAYGGSVIDTITPPVNNSDYCRYYDEVINDIYERCK